jgi:pyrroline-5-carboxylate reductase
LAVIGGGVMAGAILDGARASGRLPERVCVAEPDAARRGRFPKAVETAPEAIRWLEEAEPAPGAGVVLLAVKPQSFGAVAAELEPVGVGERLVISILAGTTGTRIRQGLGGACRVVRVMPNTPAQIGMGATAVARSAGATDADAALVRELFRGVGETVVALDESLMDAFTAVAGSGPAYLYLLAEAMEGAAVATGLPAAHARSLVVATLAGAAELLRRSGADPRELRERVTSKGGTTAEAMAVFERAGFGEIVSRAIIAARDRGRELGR